MPTVTPISTAGAESHLPTLLPFQYARKQGVLIDPIAHHFIVREDAAAFAMQECVRFSGCILPIIVMSKEDFDVYLSRLYQKQEKDSLQLAHENSSLDLLSLAESVPETEDLLDQVNEAPIIRLINAILTEAIQQSASDIHVETFEKNLTIRFRVDGVLREALKLKRALAPLLVSRIKVMAELDIAEKRLPQDGRIALKIANREVDVRISTLPSSYGERVVMRLLDKQAGRLSLSALGMNIDLELRLRTLIENPNGIVLVTGPTGSGKTTTLYAALDHLNSTQRNIMTIEDPVEYAISGVGQTQVNPRISLDFAKGLRAILRQDPDVVMVGEIRDVETVRIAVQASLTGHLVLSTLHTNSAVGAITRLQDMGVEPFLLSSSVLGVLAQRLVRVLCQKCREPAAATPEELSAMGYSADTSVVLHHSRGCPDCQQTGFRGRLGVYELLDITPQMKRAIHDQESEQSLQTLLPKNHQTIFQDGLQAVLAGHTSLEEILRVCRGR